LATQWYDRHSTTICELVGNQIGLPVSYAVSNVATTSITVNIIAMTAVAATSPEVDCVGIHD